MNPSAVIETLHTSFRTVAEMPVYDLINWFFLFSIFGYCLECVVLSFEEKRLITNRGFVHGPICVIYGFCAVIATVILSPFIASPIQLYIASALMATIAELITAHLMVHFFGAFWWDYSKKPFNYKGMISLETSVGWGFVGLFFFYFLSSFMLKIVHLMSANVSRIVAFVLVVYYLIDFGICIYMRLHGLDHDADEVGRLKVTR